MARTAVSAASTQFPRGVAGVDKQPFVLFRQRLLSHHLPTRGAARELQIPGNKADLCKWEDTAGFLQLQTDGH